MSFISHKHPKFLIEKDCLRHSSKTVFKLTFQTFQDLDSRKPVQLIFD